MDKIKNFFGKAKNWLIAHKPTRRRLIQVYAALLYNANLKGFGTGKIYRGDTKNLCVPGLNCYSCPGAIGACPLGALQNSLESSGTTVPAYVFGIIILFGLLLGRVICGFLCPFGLIQELLYKIRSPKLKKGKITRVLSYFKYVLLAITIAVPIIYTTVPAFCKYICPAGTLEGAIGLLSNAANADFYAMLGYLFSWKFALLVGFIVASVFIYRFFCRFFCPLGAIYGFFCKVAMLGVKLDKSKCIDCGACLQTCKMDIRHVGDHECIQCGACIPVCPTKAITWKGSKIFLKPTAPAPVPVAEEGIPVLANMVKPATVNVMNAETAISEPTGGTVSVWTDDPEVRDSEGIETVGTRAKGNALRKLREFIGNKKKWIELTAWIVALAVLITALVMYNLPDRQTEREQVTGIRLTCYTSAVAAQGNVFDIDSLDGTATVLYYWNMDVEETYKGIENLQSLHEKYTGQVNFIAIHTSLLPQNASYMEGNSDLDNNVWSKIKENGWEKYNLIFAQDTRDVQSYERFGGSDVHAHAVTVALNANKEVISVSQGTPTADDLSEYVNQAILETDKVYEVGDLCPLFTLETYNSANTGSGKPFSVAECRGRVTVINFWYTNCGPCVAELPEFEEVYSSLLGTENEINMVAIHSYSGLAEPVQNWLDGNSSASQGDWSKWNILFAQDAEDDACFYMLGGKGAYPVTVVVDAEGYIRFINQGGLARANLESQIEQARAPLVKE